MSVDASEGRRSDLPIATPHRRMTVVIVSVASFDILEGMYPEDSTPEEMEAIERESALDDLPGYIEMAATEGSVNVQTFVSPKIKMAAPITVGAVTHE